MKNFINKNFYSTLIIILLSSILNVFAQGSNNNCFVFNGTTSELSLLDNEAANVDAYGYFNKINSTNNSITVQAWIYLISDNAGVKMPIIYRTVYNQDGSLGTSFSLYVENNRGYFTVGNSAPVSTPEFPAFQWIQLTGIYDGTNLKIYYGKNLSESLETSPGSPYTNGNGLYVGKSDEGVFRGLIDEIRIFNIPLDENNINGSGGNGNPAEKFPSSISEYSVGQWSFTEIVNGLLYDQSTYENNLHVTGINQIYPSKNLPFFVVTSTADDPDATIGDGSAVSLNGNVTLRSAIQETNALGGTQTIYFYIPGNEPYNIVPGSALPTITDPVFLDGTTQHGYTGTPIVETSGPFGGITISGGASTVNALKINNSSGYSLTLATSGENNVSENQIGGILISSSGNSINNNTISNSVVDGIHITLGATDNLIGSLASNNITANTGNGVLIEGANGNTIANNNISANSSNGISISSSSNTNNINSNNVNGNTGFGISFNSSSGNVLTGNTVTSNNAGGVSVVNSSETLNGNTITSNSVTGILVNSDGITLSGNTISNNSGYGVNITGDNNNLSENVISSNTNIGVSIDGNGNNLDQNEIYNNTGNGVSVNSGNFNSIFDH
ncbi:MAG: right-handed parallel beta-helix repeat-containing protein, partial [Ignavibacteriaceae bacterium]